MTCIDAERMNCNYLCQKKNKYLKEFVKGGVSIELTSDDPETNDARKILDGCCNYKDYDFGGCVFTDTHGSYAIIW